MQWGFDEDIDEVIGNMCGERAAAAAAAAAQIGMGLNVAAIIGHMAFSMLPGADAVALAVKLAMGKNVTWQDIGAAALSVGGAAIIVKYGAKFARAAGGYMRKLGQRAWGWLKRGASGLLRGASRVGALDDVFGNPQILKGIPSPNEAGDLIEGARAAGWQVGALERGSHAEQGLKLSEVVDGKLTGRQIRWHPGGGHHGPIPYWTVCSPKGGKVGPIFVE